LAQRVLVCDNNAFYRQVLGDFFKSEGYEVVVAADGVEALERLSESKVDFILLDLIMPRIDGARLCRFLKSHDEYASIPVVILSGVLVDEIDGIEEIRADAYVAKMPMAKLQETLREVFAALAGSGKAPVRAGFEGMFRREVVVEFLEERRVRETILDSLAEGILELTHDGRILRSNKTIEKLLGKTPEELLSQPLDKVMPESREALAVLYRDAARNSDCASSASIALGERMLRLRLQSLNSTSAAARHIDEVFERAAAENPKVRLATAQRFPGFVLLVQDVTEEMKAQEERDKFRERMARAGRMSALGLFVAGAAHELNNPLTGVMGYAQLLGQRDLPSDVLDNMKKIEAGAARCRVIVDNLLVFSRQGQSERGPERINGILEAAMKECSERRELDDLDLEIDMPDGLPEVRVNAPELLQAISALIDNGISAALDGAPPHKLVVRTFVDEYEVVTQLIDNGPGIPEHLLSKIFDPFFTTREVGQGRGLGLSVAYGIAKAHGGSITVENRAEEGACVSLRLPVDHQEQDYATGRVQKVKHATGRRKILIVDDEEIIVELLRDFLSGEHEVHSASDGREGLRMAEESEFDLIFMDIRMPDMSGRQVFEALRSTRSHMAERIIFTTGDMVQEETRLFLEETGQPCLAKPFALESVTEALDQLLSAYKGR
jgi:signal transduction histidine kinase/DNA-binding response OmpR family regulator